MAQLGLYVGLFQLFVADKISHKGCFTLQARCPEMDFLEVGGGGGGMTLRVDQGHRPQGWPQAELGDGARHPTYKWQEQCPTTSHFSRPPLPFPRERRAAATLLGHSSVG